MAAWGGSLTDFPPRGKAAGSSAQGSVRDRPPAYPVIYNWDGAPHDYSEYPQSVEQFVEKAYAPMKDTQVGAHFWCTGEHEAKWPSKTMEMAGDSQGRLYDTVRSMRHNEGIRELLRKGENPYAALVKRGHELGMHVYASIRMNDNHFNGLQLEDMAEASIEGLTPLRKQHPEWCLGPRQAPKWFAASWNFAIPEIRELRLQSVTEVCKLADWDGVELDWQRHAFHLPLDDASRLSYTLTDLQRALRSMTRRLGRERGRPLLRVGKSGHHLGGLPAHRLRPENLGPGRSLRHDGRRGWSRNRLRRGGGSLPRPVERQRDPLLSRLRQRLLGPPPGAEVPPGMA